MTERAPAKVNLCLLLGPTRAQDGRHELVTVFEPLEFGDMVTLEDAAGAEADEVVCPGVEGPNLAADALRLFREATGWDGPPVRLTIDKRIPVAAGMAGGSADAAAALRLARRRSGLGDDRLLHELAFALGADVPGQVRPRRALATGAGERLRDLPPPARPYGVLVLPSPHQLATGSVFGEADRLGLARTAAELDDARERILARAADRVPAGAGAAADHGSPAGPPADPQLAAATGGVPLVNDLELAARSLCPQVGEALEAVRGAGAAHAMVSGSGPTVIGLFPTPADARRAAEALAGRRPAPIVTRPLGT